MTKARKQAVAVALIATLLVVADQALKVSVKTTMHLYQQVRITDWFYLCYTENNGMAFGWEFFNKYFLTLFRICLIPVIVCYILRLLGKRRTWGPLVCLALLLAGAVGNTIDCVFYGLIFDNPPPPFVAEFVPFGHGYSSVFLGRVVDMLYFPLFGWDWPSWLPLLAGRHFTFFSPIFNIADASISCGIIAILLFYSKRIFR